MNVDEREQNSDISNVINVRREIAISSTLMPMPGSESSLDLNGLNNNSNDPDTKENTAELQGRRTNFK